MIKIGYDSDGRPLRKLRGLRLCYRAAHEGRPGWRLAVEYDAAIVERIKAIPHTQRAWSPSEKEWWVDAEREAELLEIFGADFEVHLRQPSLFEVTDV